MRKLAAISDEHRAFLGGLFGSAGILVELPARYGLDRHFKCSRFSLVCRYITTTYPSSHLRSRCERIRYADAENLLPIVQIFGIQNGGAASRRRYHH
jgi:hypothetical protein